MPPGIMKMVPGTRSAYPSAPANGMDAGGMAQQRAVGRRMPPAMAPPTMTPPAPGMGSAIPPSPSGIGASGGGAMSGMDTTAAPGAPSGIGTQKLNARGKPMPPMGGGGMNGLE